MPRQADRQRLEAGCVGRTDGRRRGVVAKLELVHEAGAEQTLQVEDGVGRIRRHARAAAGHTRRVAVRALVVEHAHVHRPVLAHCSRGGR